MRVTYDPSAQAAYIYLTSAVAPGDVKKTISTERGINLDFDVDGHLIGIELLGADLLHPELAAIARAPGRAQ